jgi:hypothetical protein
MLRTVIVSLAIIALLVPALGATPQGSLTITVTAQATSGPYTGAATTAALETDYENMAAAAGVGGQEACWPLNDNIQSSGTDFINDCTAQANYISFDNQSGGFVTGFSTPTISTPNDSEETQFNNQGSRLPSSSTLTSAAPWTVGVGINPGASPVTSMDILNTGAPNVGSGMEIYLNSTGHIVISLAGSAPLTTSVGDSTGTHTQFVFVTWQPTSGTGGILSYYVHDNTTGVTTSLVNHVVTAWSSNSTPFGIVYPTSGSGTGPYVGYMGWVSTAPAAYTQTQINTLITDTTGTQPPPPPINNAAPVTLSSYALANAFGFNSEFSYGSDVIEGYNTAASIRNLKFMNVTHLRDSPNGGGSPLYAQLCTAGIGYNQGFQAISSGDGVSPFVPLTIGAVTSMLDSEKSAYGCYPQWLDPANELDNYRDSGEYSNHFGYDDDVNTASPQSACSALTSTCDVPRWAYYLVEEVQTLRAAVNSNAKYAGIQVYGPGLANPPLYPTLSQAQYDVCVLNNGCGSHFSSNNTSSNYTYGSLFPVDYSTQHANVSAQGGIPSDATTGGLTNSPITGTTAIYVKETTSGHSPSGGFSGYAAPGAPGYITETYDEVGIGLESMYYASGNDIDNPMSVHYGQRDVLKMVSLGLTPLYFDFLGDKASTTYSTSFAQVGWTDVLGNLKPMGYALANGMHLVGYGETAPRPSLQQLSFKVVTPGTTTTPSNVQAYSYQKQDGTYWVALVDNSTEGVQYPNAGQSNLLANQPSPYPKISPGLTPCSPQSTDPNQDNCFSLEFQGKHFDFSGFTTVNITGLPANITHAAVYQNDEYCDNTETQDSIVRGEPYPSYPTGANTDCDQYWPAGSLKNSVQPSYPTISNNSISGIKFNGSVVWIHLGNSQLAPVPTMTPMPFTSAATPGPDNPPPARQTPLPTPIPQFGPPTGTVPTPPV